MPLARGALAITTGGSLTVTGSFQAINAANIPALVTAASGLVEMDSPSAGRLRYLGAPATVSVSAFLSTTAGIESAQLFSYRIAQSGTALAASEQSRDQFTFEGSTGVSLSMLTAAFPGDVFEVVVSVVGASASLTVAHLTLVVQEIATAASEVLPAPLGGTEWAALEDLVNVAMVAGPLGQTATYTPLPGGPLSVRAVFDLSGYEVDLQSGLRVATGIPELAVRDADIGRAALKGDLVTVAGRNYTVAAVLESGQVGFSKCALRDAT
jgi:hypothetical protein